MSKKKILDHVHKLKRIKYTNGEAIYFCIRDECEYEINVRKALGKPNECHRCGKKFNLNEQSLRLAKPHCNDCTKAKGDHDKKTVVSPLPLVEDLRSRLNRAIGESNSTTDSTDDLL